MTGVVELVAHAQVPRRKVDVSPYEPERFGDTKAAEEQQCDERVVPAGRGVEQRGDLVVSEEALAGGAGLGFLAGGERVGGVGGE